MVSQLIVNALIAASLYAIVGIGFALIFRVGGFFNFAHGLNYTLGAYLVLLFHQRLCLPLLAEVAMAIVGTTVVALLSEGCVFAPLRARGAGNLVLLLASIGLYVVGQNAISLISGDGAQSIRPQKVVVGIWLAGARITSVQLLAIVIAVIVGATVTSWLRLTATGRHVRAVADDQVLATVLGVPTKVVVSVVMAVGGALAALAGILAAMDRDMVPTMGMPALLMGVVSTVIGGVSSTAGVVLAALLVAFAQNLSILWVPAAWQDAIVFAILVAFLVLRPQGFLGRAIHSTNV